MNREIANTLAIKNNPYRVLQFIRATGYYRDLFPVPPGTPDAATSSLSTLHKDFFAAAYFVNRLSNKWEMWAPFEEALYDLPLKGFREMDPNKPKVMMILRDNILAFAYAIAIVVPYQHHPFPAIPSTTEQSVPTTVPGYVVQSLGHRLIRPWQLIDHMFCDQQNTSDSVYKVLGIETLDQWEKFLETYGPYWAGYVLCACILRWTELVKEAEWASEYDVLWRKTEASWMRVCQAIDKVRWKRWSKVKEDIVATGPEMVDTQELEL
jgi:hypothetical protein